MAQCPTTLVVPRVPSRGNSEGIASGMPREGLAGLQLGLGA